MLFMSLYDGNVHQELFLCGSAAAASAHSQTIVTPTVRQVCAAALQPSSSSLKERHQLEAPGRQQPWVGVVSQPGGCFIYCLRHSEAFGPAGS